MELSPGFLLKALSITILLASVACSSDAAEIKHDEGPILPKEPMVINIGSSVTVKSGRVEYRGCYKFCVGSVSAYPSSSSSDNNVWNPFNQSTNQVYYFRYVDVDMGDCQWPRWAEYPGLQIPELFFDTDTDSDRDSSYSYNNRVDRNNNVGYVLSYPTNLQNDKFTFLIYHPDITPRYRWTVRWTGFMDNCNKNGTLPIDLHYEPDAFDAKEYITFPKW